MSVKPEQPVRGRYIEATGGRKTARARVRLFERGNGIVVNALDFEQYFRTFRNRMVARSPLNLVDMTDKVRVTVNVVGGGINAQADAMGNALAKALVKLNADFKTRLRRSGFITRDARMVERKKYGLKKARRAPQWKKR